MNKEKKNKNTKILVTIIGVILVVLIAILIVSLVTQKEEEEETTYSIFEDAKLLTLNSYSAYQENEELLKSLAPDTTLKEEDFTDYKYVAVMYTYNSCGETVERTYYKNKGDNLNIYYDTKTTCGVCAPLPRTDIIKVKNADYKDNIRVYYKVVSKESCDPNVAYKPMIYIYPTKTMDLTIELGNSDLLTTTYPKYKNAWHVRVTSDGNIYDYETKRNYYGLYWEALDYTPLNMDEGFVIAGKDTISFLEEKLAILGLNDYEINEFIVYWINKLENNPYNFIRFRTPAEINAYMPLKLSEKPDTLIRILMDFKPLEKKIEVQEQSLEKITRKGFTVVEWGVTPHIK